MKITVENLGAVKQAEIDLKPLTVFVGHNSTGKTWTAYALASIFSEYGRGKYLESYSEGKTQQTYPVLEEAIEKYLQEGSAEINIVEFVKDNMQTYINDVACLSPSWMRNYLATKHVNFDALKIKIDLSSLEIQELTAQLKKLPCNISVSIASRKINLFKDKDSAQMFFFLESKNNNNEPLPVQIVKPFIYACIFEILQRNFFDMTYLLPTERTTFITFPFIEVRGNINSFDKVEHYMSYPVWKLTKMISDASLTLDYREDLIKKEPRVKEYINLSVFLEEKILRGKSNFEESGVNKELLFSTENVKLEMGITSSMIKELIPLVLYLRHYAFPNDLIVIDEPEMHLHPAAQIEIIEFIAMLVNAGLNVLITTHSPYIVDHISNLIEAEKHHNKEEIKEFFYLEDSRAFIAQDKVSVYLFEDGTAMNILAEDGSINWETFWNVSSDVSGIYGQLLKNKKD